MTQSDLFQFQTFGSLLHYLRRRARLTQRELAIATGYSEAHISRLERDQRTPDLTAIAALFIPQLNLETEPEYAAHLMELAARARGETLEGQTLTLSSTTTKEYQEEIGVIEALPVLPEVCIERALLQPLADYIRRQRSVQLCGQPGAGKTVIAAQLARRMEVIQPVFWLSFHEGINLAVEVVMRQLALCAISLGAETVFDLVNPEVEQTPHMNQQLLLIVQALKPHGAIVYFDNAHLLNQEPNLLQAMQYLIEAQVATVVFIAREPLNLAGLRTYTLGGLTAKEASALSTQLAPEHSAEVHAALVKHTNGHPMLLRLALGQLQHHAQAVFVERLVTRPQISQYLVETTLANLSPDARTLTELLAVANTPLDIAAPLFAEHVQTKLGACAFYDAINELLKRYLIEEPTSASLPPLIRDHIYSTLMNDLQRRRQLHEIIAEWFANQQVEPLLVAHHYARAGNSAAAMQALDQHNETIINHGQSTPAVEIIDYLLNVHRPQGHIARSELLCLKGDFLICTVRANEAEQSYREALGLVRDAIERAHIIWRMSGLLLQRGLVQEALHLIQEALQTIPATEQVLRGHLWGVESKALLMVSQFEAALQSAEAALTITNSLYGAQRVNGDLIRCSAGSTRAIVLGIQQQVDACITQWREVALAAKRTGKRRHYLRVIANLGNVYVEQGMFSIALQTYQEALSGLQQIGDVYAAARVLHGMGLLHFYHAEWTSALQSLDESIALKEHISDYQGIASSTAQKALVFISQGAIQDARGLIQTALVDARLTGEERFRLLYSDSLGLVALLQRDWNIAEQCFTEVAQSNVAQTDPRIACVADSHLGLLELARGNIHEARVYIERPLAIQHTETYLERLLIQAAYALVVNDHNLLHETVQHFEANVGEYRMMEAAMEQISSLRDTLVSAEQTPWLIFSPDMIAATVLQTERTAVELAVRSIG